MLILDTHIWIKFINGDIPDKKRLRAIAQNECYISVISIWEVCKLHEKGRIRFKVPLETWVGAALKKGIMVAELSPAICLDACALPDNFHGDPADQIIVATARCHDSSLMTDDRKIRKYRHVSLFDGSL